jgi:hypothetical protein
VPEQENLFGEIADPADVELGRSQRAILRVLREQENGLWDDEAGAVIHASRGKHDLDERCGWCQEDGAAVLDRLHEHRPLARTPDGRRRLSTPNGQDGSSSASPEATSRLQPGAAGESQEQRA